MTETYIKLSLRGISSILLRENGSLQRLNDWNLVFMNLFKGLFTTPNASIRIKTLVCTCVHVCMCVHVGVCVYS